MGRPSTYSEEAAEKICSLLATGKSLRAICADNEDLPYCSTVRYWVIQDREGFASRYTRARDIGIDAMVDEALEIAAKPVRGHITKRLLRAMNGSDITDADIDDPQAGVEVEVVTKDNMERSRLHVDTIKWYVSKIAPRKYGDKLAIEHSGNVGIEERLREGRNRLAGNG